MEIERTVFFGVISVGPWDIMYPVHSTEDLKRARNQKAATGQYEYEGLRVVVYFDQRLSPARCHEVAKQAYQAANGKAPGIEVPRYSENGAQE